MATPTVDRFLGELAQIIEQKNGPRLQEYLIIEPPFNPLYSEIIAELRKVYPEFNQAPLEEKCKTYISEFEEGEEGGSRLSLITFVVRYLTFLRDVNIENLVETHDLLKSLLK